MIKPATIIAALLGGLIALQFRVKVIDLVASSLDQKVFIKCLEYNTPCTMKGLLQLFRYSGLRIFQEIYAGTKFPEITIRQIYREFIERPELHRFALPPELFIHNPILLQLLREDSGKYQPKAFDVWTIDEDVLSGPWGSLILSTAANNPAVAGLGYTAYLAYKQKVPKAWELHTMYYRTHSWHNIGCWIGERPLFMGIIQVATDEPSLGSKWRHDLAKTLTPNTKSKNNVFNKDYMFDSSHDLAEFLLLKDKADKFYAVLEHLNKFLSKESPSRTCLWHGKLVYVALTSANSTRDNDSFLLQITVEYFLLFDANLYSAPLLHSILGLIGIIGLDLPAKDTLLAKLNTLQALHTHLPPIWEGRQSLIAFWRGNQDFGEPIEWPKWILGGWPAGTPEWPKIVIWLQDNYAMDFSNVIQVNFLSTLELSEHSNPRVVCYDVYCFLKKVPPILLKATDGFRETKNGYELVETAFLPESFWKTVGRIILTGLFYEGRDVFNLSDSSWNLLYDPEQDGAYSIISQVLELAGVFGFRGSNRIQ